MPEVEAAEESATAGVVNPGIDASLFAGHAAVRISEMAPADLWAALRPDTRRWWLDIAGEPLGYRSERWEAIPARCRRQLQLTMRQIMVFLTGTGLDLSGLRK